MKHIKLFEDLQNIPEVGDYVIANSKYTDEDSQNFFLNNIGKVIRNREIDELKRFVEVEYNNVPKNILVDNNNWLFLLDEILYWSKDKNELETLLASKKYNL